MNVKVPAISILAGWPQSRPNNSKSRKSRLKLPLFLYILFCYIVDTPARRIDVGGRENHIKVLS